MTDFRNDLVLHLSAIVLGLALLFGALATLSTPVSGAQVWIRDKSDAQVVLYQESHALLIAAGNYNRGWPRLTNVENEIEEVAAALRHRDFSVQIVPHPTGQQMRNAIEDFIAEHGYSAENRLLIFFSGHGHTRPETDMGYIVPVNAPDPNVDETGFLRVAISMHTVMAWAKRIEAKHALFVFDSCFSGSLFETRALGKPGQAYIRNSTAKPVRQFITAGDAEEEVPAISVFTPQFIAALDGAADYTGDGYVTGEELGVYLKQTVPNYNSTQSPQSGKIRDPKYDKGDFVFRVQDAPGKVPIEGEKVDVMGPGLPDLDQVDVEGLLKDWCTRNPNDLLCDKSRWDADFYDIFKRTE